MAVSRTGFAVSLLFASSASLGAAILAVDNVLWKYAPSHAYGLAGFTAINIALIVLLVFKSKKVLLFAGVWGTIEFVILTANMLVGAQFGVTGFTQQELTAYFLGILVEHGASPTFGFYKISPYAYIILVSIQALIAITGLLGYRSARRVPSAI